MRKKVEVTCKGCGEKWLKRKDSLTDWDGSCRPCAMRELGSRAGEIARRSAFARVQYAAQGGIANARKFTSEMTSGPRNHRWRGGGKPRRRDRPKWWARAVFERDKYTCVLCGATGVPLNADHIVPVRADESLRFSLENGRTLCVPCHYKTDTFGWKAVRSLANSTRH